jgi:tetratricopeptide (TPR) repeat protein
VRGPQPAGAVGLPQARSLLEQALTIAQASGDKTGLADTEWNLAQLGIYLASPDHFAAHSARALALARELDSPELGSRDLVARTLNQIAFAETVWGQLAGAVGHADEARALYAALGNRAMEADSLCLLSDACVRSGELGRGLDAARAARAISLEIENSWGQANSAIRLALGLLESGHYGQALKTVRTGIEVARVNNIPPLLILSLVIAGNIYRALFSLDEARAAHQEAAQIAESLGGQPYFEEMAAAELCADCAVAGDWPQAAEHSRRAFRLHNPKVIVFPGLTRWHLAEALIRVGEADRASDDAQAFEALIGDNRRYRLVHLRMLAVLASPDARLRYWREAASLAEAIGLPGELWQLCAALGEAQRAAEIVQSLAAHVHDESLRTTFIAAATHRISNRN